MVIFSKLEQKQKYAAWKAADIRKALKEGRKPTPGPPAGDEDMSIPSNTPSNTYDLGTTGTTVTSPGPESDPSHNFHDPVNYQHLQSIHPASEFHDTINNHDSTNIPPSMQFHDRVGNNENSSNISPPSPPYPSTGYPSQDYHHPPPSQDYHPPPSSQDYHSSPPARSEGPSSLGYNHQQYSQEHSQNLDPNYSHETPSYSYTHFQSYPGFSESSLPSVPLNYSYYQGSDASTYSSQSAPPTTNHSSSTQQSSLGRNGTVSEPNSTTQTYQYDSNYQPPPEKIAEAHKAARFAVGALAFDDVSTAVDFLRKSLELLTNSSSGQQD
ncbi:Vacuolar protein sorting-associate protein Vta1/Callose synthase, N-terminal [Sesbania bispinosa]|nr:Vacuolar protein sorting-associate protein Vta1/Callose synthase, N-terminal [Sesbania bispinosa]